MIVSIPARKLKKYLWRTGPYLYFLDERIEGKNNEVFEYIEKMANKYSEIKVLKINCEDKNSFLLWTLQTESNKMYLYFDGEKIEDKILSDKDTVNSLFEKAVVFYNVKIDKKVKNIGTKSILNPRNYENPTKFKQEKYIRESNYKYRKNYLLKKKINNEKTLEYFGLRNNIQFKPKIIRNSEISVNTLKNSKSFVNKIEMEKNNIFLSEKWFHDATISDLPDRIFSNQTSQRYFKNN